MPHDLHSPTSRSLRSFIVVLGLLVTLSAATVVGAEPSPGPLRVQAIGWDDLTFARSNAWVSVSSRIALREVSAAALEAQGLSLGFDGGQSPGVPETDALLLLRAENQAGMNLERVSLWVEPAAGSLLQRCRVAYGRNDRRAKCYRYQDELVFRERREEDSPGSPEGSAAEWLSSEPASDFVPQWPVSSQQKLRLPSRIAPDAGLVSPLVLFPLASVAPFDRVGDKTAVYVHTDQDFYRVSMRFAGHEATRVDYEQLAPSGARRQIDGSRKVMVIDIEPTALTNPDEEFELLGLTPPLQLLLDPHTRVPLEIRGRTSWVGRGQVQLKRVQLTR